MTKLDAVLKTVFSNMNADNVQIIDLRNASAQEQNQNIANIYTEVQKGRQANAVNVFSQTYRVEGTEAEKVINAMKTGQGFNLSQLHSKYNFVAQEIIGIVALIFILPLIITIIAVLVVFISGMQAN